MFIKRSIPNLSKAAQNHNHPYLSAFICVHLRLIIFANYAISLTSLSVLVHLFDVFVIVVVRLH